MQYNINNWYLPTNQLIGSVSQSLRLGSSIWISKIQNSMPVEIGYWPIRGVSSFCLLLCIQNYHSIFHILIRLSYFIQKSLLCSWETLLGFSLNTWRLNTKRPDMMILRNGLVNLKWRQALTFLICHGTKMMTYTWVKVVPSSGIWGKAWTGWQKRHWEGSSQCPGSGMRWLSHILCQNSLQSRFCKLG